VKKLIHKDKQALIEYLSSIHDSIEELLSEKYYDNTDDYEYLELIELGDSGLGILIIVISDCLEEDDSGPDFYGNYEGRHYILRIILSIEGIAVNLFEFEKANWGTLSIMHGELSIYLNDSFIEESAQQAIEVIQNLPNKIDIPIESIQHYYDEMEIVKQQIHETSNEREKITQRLAQLDDKKVGLKEKLENIHENTAKLVLQSMKQKIWKDGLRRFHSDIN
jgi:hypothetical protein